VPNDFGILPPGGAGWQWRWFSGRDWSLFKRFVDQLLKTPPHTFAQLMRKLGKLAVTAIGAQNSST
jgi:hypothetical protein